MAPDYSTIGTVLAVLKNKTCTYFVNPMPPSTAAAPTSPPSTVSTTPRVTVQPVDLGKTNAMHDE